MEQANKNIGRHPKRENSRYIFFLLAATLAAASVRAGSLERMPPISVPTSKAATSRPESSEPKDAEARFTVTAVTSFEKEQSQVLLSEMETELNRLLETPSIRVEWVDLRAAEGRSFSNRLVVVKFTGSCQSGNMVAETTEGALGHTHVSDGEVLPFVEVNCDKIWGFIKREIRSCPGLRDHYFGVALGRVVAHELYHVIATTAKHAKQGVAKPTLTALELTSSTLELGQAEANLMIRSLRPKGRSDVSSALAAH